MSTYAQERAEKNRQQAARAPRFVFRAAGFDLVHPGPYTPEDGAIVVKMQPYGCPRNGTMGQCYVANSDGEFLGMVDQRSLMPVRRSARR